MYIKRKHLPNKECNAGFTLIEVLVAMVIAVLVITPLLGFMINILETDKKEQAKAASEQEIQAAMDYIARDLEQAIYIYDARGVNRIIQQLPTPANSLPVLVFWKREILAEDRKVPVPGLTGTANRDDGFIYSLVAYYLTNNASNTGNIWSNQHSIRRFAVRGGVKDPANPNQYITTPDLRPEAGFRMFNLELDGTLEDKMNAWQRDGNFAATNIPVPLVDFIDTSIPQPSNTAYAPINPTDCATIFTDKNTTEKRDALRVPAYQGNTYAYPNLTLPNTAAFYACVDVERQIAQVFIRGNALARIRNSNVTFDPGGESKQRDESYFPNVSIKVKARGIIGAD